MNKYLIKLFTKSKRQIEIRIKSDKNFDSIKKELIDKIKIKDDYRTIEHSDSFQEIIFNKEIEGFEILKY